MKRLVLVEKSCLVLILLSLAACRGDLVHDQDPDLEQGDVSIEDQVEISPQTEPTIDGIMEEGEWQAATIHHAEDGSEVHLLFSGDYLYLAVRAEGSDMIAGNVFLSRGDQIFILHTSAALGTAVYQRGGDVYQKVKDFEWCCRSRLGDQASQDPREEFYVEEGWLGINSFLGNPQELEYKILLTGAEEYAAVNFLRADPPHNKQVWPIGLEDGTAQPVDGGFPESINFSVMAWYRLE